MSVSTIGFIIICVIGVGVYIIEKRLIEIQNVLIEIRQKLGQN